MRRLLLNMPGGAMLRRVYRLFNGGDHWARVVMNRATLELVGGLSPGKLKALEISGRRWEKTPFKSYMSVDYPDFDICGSQLQEKFDLIIAEQVFEHLLWPYRAGRNVFEMLNPGGCFLVSTPFLLRIHNLPTDCTRWTETGMRHFLAECGFRPDGIRTGSWGNRACVKANFSDWKIYRPLFHSLRNEPDYPVVVWALARK
jgi:SAM-dependent methyltransferase